MLISSCFSCSASETQRAGEHAGESAGLALQFSQIFCNFYLIVRPYNYLPFPSGKLIAQEESDVKIIVWQGLASSNPFVYKVKCGLDRSSPYR
jgi:hypothetical protein